MGVALGLGTSKAELRAANIRRLDTWRGTATSHTLAGAAPLGVKVERSVDRHVSPAGMGVVPKDARKEMPRGSTIIPLCLAALVLVA